MDAMNALKSKTMSAPAEGLKDAVTMNPKSATPSINAEHIQALVVMVLGMQKALGDIMPVINTMGQAVSKLIAEHEGIKSKVNAPPPTAPPAPPMPPQGV